MERENLIIIIMAIAMGGFAWSWLAGYFQLQWYYFLGVLGVLGGAFFFSHKKTMKVHGWREVIEKNKEDLKALGVMTETGHKTVRVSMVDEHIDVNDKGKYWYMVFGDNPTFHPLLFSAKTGKLVHVDMRGTIDESPLKSAREKPVPPQMIGQTHEIKYEEKVKPQKEKPAPQ